MMRLSALLRNLPHLSTNALELGIDLGMLDVVITLGFEGSVSSVRQRLGRAGRSKRPSLGILVGEPTCSVIGFFTFQCSIRLAC